MAVKETITIKETRLLNVEISFSFSWLGKWP